MPIRANLRRYYRGEWEHVRRSILERAADRCEECGVANHAIGRRRADGDFEQLAGLSAEVAALDGKAVIRIVLTVAHLDHNPANNAPENLRALCQRCHLRHDQKIHAASARRAALARRRNRARGNDPAAWRLRRGWMKQGNSPYDPFFERIADMVADRLMDRLDRPGRLSLPRLLTVDQAAEYLARSPDSVRHLVHRRILPAVRNGRRVFLDRADLDSFIERTKVSEG